MLGGGNDGVVGVKDVRALREVSKYKEVCTPALSMRKRGAMDPVWEEWGKYTISSGSGQGHIYKGICR